MKMEIFYRCFFFRDPCQLFFPVHSVGLAQRQSTLCTGQLERPRDEASHQSGYQSNPLSPFCPLPGISSTWWSICARRFLDYLPYPLPRPLFRTAGERFPPPFPLTFPRGSGSRLSGCKLCSPTGPSIKNPYAGAAGPDSYLRLIFFAVINLVFDLPRFSSISLSYFSFFFFLILFGRF